MSFSPIPTAEKIALVQRLITDEPDLNGYRSKVLKAIAADLRGRLDGAPSVALTTLEQRLIALARRHPSDRVNAQINIAEELMARWPIIKQALERFGAEIEQEIIRA